MAHIENITFDLKTTDVNGCKMPFKRFDGIDYNFWTFYPDNIKEHLKDLSNLEIRPDDVFICSYPRSGTNWTHEIARMLKAGSSSFCNKDLDWIDILPRELFDKMKSPRIFFSHLPFQYLPKQLNEKGRIICVSRNPKDVAVSFYHYFLSINFAEFDGSFDDFLTMFLSGDLPGGSWFDHVKSWENGIASNTANPVLQLSFESLKRDLRGCVEKIADFLNVPYNDELFSNIVENCRTENMLPEKKAHVPVGVVKLSRNKGNFLYRKGLVGDWKNTFTVAQNEKFDMVYEEKMKDLDIALIF